MLGVEPRRVPKDLMLAVAHGAALYQKEFFSLPKTQRKSKILGDSLGIMVEDRGQRRHKILLMHNEKLPSSAKYTFSIDYGQDEVTINLAVLQGNTEKASRQLKTRNLKLSAQASEIAVEINVDENRMITLVAYDPLRPQDQSIIKVENTEMTVEGIRSRQDILGITTTAPSTVGNLQPCVGIDLGTTTSELSYANRSGDTDLCYLENPGISRAANYATYCFPSVVYLKNGLRDKCVADTEAINARFDCSADNKVFDSFKVKDRFRPITNIDDKNIMVRDLTAILLSKIWQTAQDHFKDIGLSSAIITVPAAFNSDECQETYEAAKIAGIKDVILIDEPTAAFYYYRHLQQIDTENIRNVLVFDFGGGTADVAILDIQCEAVDTGAFKDGRYKVLATSGDPKCGGRDVDEELYRRVALKYEKENQCELSAAARKELRREVEKAKISLSEAYMNKC